MNLLKWHQRYNNNIFIIKEWLQSYFGVHFFLLNVVKKKKIDESIYFVYYFNEYVNYKDIKMRILFIEITLLVRFGLAS